MGGGEGGHTVGVEGPEAVGVGAGAEVLFEGDEPEEHEPPVEDCGTTDSFIGHYRTKYRIVEGFYPPETLLLAG